MFNGEIIYVNYMQLNAELFFCTNAEYVNSATDKMLRNE